MLRAALPLLAALALAQPPAAEAPGPGAATLDALAALNGGAPRAVVMTIFTPDGPERTVLPWPRFAELWAALAAGGADGSTISPMACGVEPLGWWCGPDAGVGADASGACDTFSAWVAHRGEPGAAYTIREPGESPGPMLCGGYIVPWSWTLVEMSAVQVPEVLATVLFEGCYALGWTVHDDGFCPNSFPRLLAGPGDGALDTWLLHWRASGPGVALAFDLGTYRLDYFAGAAATLTGDTAHGCYDLPSGHHLDGAAFPCP